MPTWTVVVRLVPAGGATKRSQEDVNTVAASIRERFWENLATATGSPDEFVVSAKVAAEIEDAARFWAMETLYSSITDALTDWRLAGINVTRAAG